MTRRYPTALTEELGQLFAPELILPAQFLPPARRRLDSIGEYRLLMGILEDAIHIYLKHGTSRGPRNRTLFRETEGWIESTSKEWVFSFERVCEALNIDPEYLRRMLRAQRRRAPQLPTMPPLDGREFRRAVGQ
jgi:hypothetical protein